MSGPRARLALALAGLALLAGVVLLAVAKPSAREAGQRPELMLLTTLPIVFAERMTPGLGAVAGARGAAIPLSRRPGQHRRRRPSLASAGCC